MQYLKGRSVPGVGELYRLAVELDQRHGQTIALRDVIKEEMTEGQQNRKYVFSFEQMQQEVGISERGSVETTLLST